MQWSSRGAGRPAQEADGVLWDPTEANHYQRWTFKEGFDHTGPLHSVQNLCLSKIGVTETSQLKTSKIMRTARSNQSDFKIKSIQLQNPNTIWISGKLQNPSSEGAIRHLLTAAKTEGEQNAVGAWRKGEDLYIYIHHVKISIWEWIWQSFISLQIWWWFSFRCGKMLSRKWGEDIYYTWIYLHIIYEYI